MGQIKRNIIVFRSSSCGGTITAVDTCALHYE